MHRRVALQSRLNMLRAVLLVALLPASILLAQDTSAVPDDPVIARAKQLVTDGRGAEGRRVLDSLLKATAVENPRYAEALYWRAALAATAAAAERDYERLLIEVPLSERAEDAMLQLAQLEQARGDRKSATEHLQRFMISYAKSPARPRVSVWLVRLLFEQGPSQTARACEALRAGRAEVPPDNAELRNQLEFYSPRCADVAVASADSQPAAAPPESTAVRDTTRRESTKLAPRPVRTETKTRVTETKTKATATKTKATATKSRTAEPKSKSAPAEFYSVQLAAYDSREPALRLMQVLKSRGIDARVDGRVRPYRVRVGKYTTRAQAEQAAARLKAQGHGGFVAVVQNR